MPEPVCCCKAGRCERDEKGAGEERAQELPGDRCCKYTSSNGKWKKAAVQDCHNSKQKALDLMLADARPEESHTQDECRGQLQSAMDGFKKLVDNETFHGTWVVSAHRSHLSEELLHNLFVAGHPMEPGHIGSRIFAVAQSAKMLWCGLAADLRARWKQYWGAGELSRGDDTDFAKDVVEPESVNQLRKCKFEKWTAVFWEASK